MGYKMFLPSNEMLSLGTERDVVGEVERLSPIYDFPIRVMAVFGAKGRPAYETLEHDGTQ